MFQDGASKCKGLRDIGWTIRPCDPSEIHKGHEEPIVQWGSLRWMLLEEMPVNAGGWEGGALKGNEGRMTSGPHSKLATEVGLEPRPWSAQLLLCSP